MTGKTRSPIKRLLKWLGVLVLLVAALVVWQWYSVQREISQIHAQLRAAGLPATAAELEDYYAIPDGSVDSTELWTNAFDSLLRVKVGTITSPIPILDESRPPIPRSDEPWPMLSTAREFLALNPEMIASIHQAAAENGAARFPISFVNGSATMLRDADQLRRCQRWLLLDSHVRAHDGDWHAVHRDIIAMFAVSNALKQQPTMISFLIRKAMFADACRRAIETLPQHQWDDSELAALQSVIRKVDPRAEFVRAINGHRAMLSVDLKTISPNLSRTANEYKALSTFGELHDSFSVSWSEGISVANRQSIERRKIDDNPLLRARYFPWFTAIGEVIVIAPSSAPNMAVMSRSADTLIATQRYRLKHKNFPDELTQLVPTFLPSIPIDPFSGQPLIYVHTADSATVYSVGKNQKDDGGGKLIPLENGPDVGLRIPR